jgi:class 3 adenylate cyclase
MLYLFDNYEFDTEQRELRRRDGSLIPVQPQVFDLLEYLIRYRERMVSKDELMGAIWGGRIVSESALSARVNAARTAVGDNGRDQRLIRTLIRRGLRFVGTVREARRLVEGAGEDRSTLPEPVLEQPSTGERRQLTVLSCELLVETTAGVEDIEPEEWHDIVGAYHRYVGTMVGRLSGFVGRRTGQTVLVYFGYPMAHDDDAKRAVRAGLDVCTTIGTLMPKYGRQLRCRAGIATGAVLMGSDSSNADSIFGAAPNLALRLHSIASPGSVVIDAITRHLVGDLFVYRDLGLSELAGHAEPRSADPVTDVHGRSRTAS